MEVYRRIKGRNLDGCRNRSAEHEFSPVDEEALKETGVTEKQLPELVDTTDKFKGIKSEYAKIIGIDKDVYFVMGATDGALSTIGLVPFKPVSSQLTLEPRLQ